MSTITKQYTNGDTCTISANPGSSHTFSGWYENGNVVSNDNPYSFTVNSSRTLTGTFSPNSYTITGAVSPVNGGSVSGAGTYDYGDTCTITATPNANYTFATWEDGNGNFLSNSNPFSFTVSRDMTVKAIFSTGYNTCTITVLSSHGTISGDGVYAIGDTVNLSCTPDTGYDFDGWYENGNLVSSNNPYSFTASVDRTIECVYEELQTYTITIRMAGSGHVLISKSSPYYYGDSLTLTAVPNTHFTFFDWQDEYGAVIGNDNPYTFTITEDRTIWAIFDRDPNLHVETNDTSSIQMLSNNTYSWYTLNLDSGDNYYYGDLQDYALNQISGLKKGSSNADKLIRIDAYDLTSWTSVAVGAFGNCTNLEHILLPDSITNIGQQAFISCSSLEEISLVGVSTIGNNAFNSCASLEEIILPDTITSIGDRAFQSCTGLTSIKCVALTPPTIGYGAFDNTNNCPIYVISSLVSTYQTAWPDYASRIVALS